ncbi:CLUMA_CG009263, isoform A [Clunio marinus]|uniref:CLUMA_CG009263, isoform A n=1 Tax=Clunio marinus TaxID=568069 RepID=A0A1J1I6J0_9DIPT|nr:CLUMA_CG009263, isoform A [Clunio marinus]
MKIITLCGLVLQWTIITAEDPKSTQVNEVNPDGSFQFGYQNKDQGGHYHQASGHPAIKIRGRYGARSPINGRVDEVVYTAGPRGFRARGANIHRKQDLSQAPKLPVGSPTDPLADPYDDPSYSFGFKSKKHSRREESDSSGKVHGEFIYVDDVGEKHGVKYKAGANTGFEVENGLPDASNSIRYNKPLYRAEPTARGRITFERGPDRQYKFLTSSPDQRRAETTGPDGVTRGSYSYLDDKGVQRTVKYIAGAGIGYKVVESTVGPGTHVAANSDVPENSIKAVSNEIAVADRDDEVHYHTGPSAPSGPGFVSSTVAPPTSYEHTTPSPYLPSVTSTPYTPTTYAPTHTPSVYPSTPFSTVSPYPSTLFSTVGPHPSTPRPFARPSPDPVFVTTPSTIGGIDRNQLSPHTFPSGGPSPLAPSAPSGSGEVDIIYGLLPPKEEPSFAPHYASPPSGPLQVVITPAPPLHQSASPTPAVLYPPTPTYLPTAEEGPRPHPYVPPVLEHYHPHPEATNALIQNTSNGWFYGIPPGAAVRAHIQNIDLIPTHNRALSPSEALRLDEEREASRHYRSHQNSHPRV